MSEQRNPNAPMGTMFAIVYVEWFLANPWLGMWFDDGSCERHAVPRMFLFRTDAEEVRSKLRQPQLWKIVTFTFGGP